MASQNANYEMARYRVLAIAAEEGFVARNSSLLFGLAAVVLEHLEQEGVILNMGHVSRAVPPRVKSELEPYRLLIASRPQRAWATLRRNSWPWALRLIAVGTFVIVLIQLIRPK